MTKKEQALIEQYAKSLVQVCQERDTLEALQADVLAILEVFKATNLAKTLSSLAVPRAKKLELVRQLQGDNIIYLNNFFRSYAAK